MLDRLKKGFHERYREWEMVLSPNIVKLWVKSPIASIKSMKKRPKAMKREKLSLMEQKISKKFLISSETHTLEEDYNH